MTEKGTAPLHEGRIKRLYADPDSSNRVILEFTDYVYTGRDAKREEVPGKGKLACETSSFLMKYLKQKGIETHLVEKMDGPKIRCVKALIFPFVVVCRNLAAGSFSKRYDVEKGTKFPQPVVEFFMKNEEIHGPMITPDAITNLGYAKILELAFLRSVTRSVNYYLGELMKQLDLTLVDFRLEFGVTDQNEIVITDEISGDTMRVWDKRSVPLDKDLFHEEGGNIFDAYMELLERLVQSDSKKIITRIEHLQVHVMPKLGLKNPSGEVIRKALLKLGFEDIEDIRLGKAFDITLRRPITSEVLKQLEEMSVTLLSNPLSESFNVRL
ncbi:MAG: phosphoribosylaminoimidazolesuccinocarboxamide synthase [Candidatus Thorarchaeota archaeon]